MFFFFFLVFCAFLIFPSSFLGHVWCQPKSSKSEDYRVRPHWTRESVGGWILFCHQEPMPIRLSVPTPGTYRPSRIPLCCARSWNPWGKETVFVEDFKDPRFGSFFSRKTDGQYLISEGSPSNPHPLDLICTEDFGTITDPHRCGQNPTRGFYIGFSTWGRWKSRFVNENASSIKRALWDFLLPFLGVGVYEMWNGNPFRVGFYLLIMR